MEVLKVFGKNLNYNMEYSTNNIFKNHGQYNRVVTIQFKEGSYSAKTFGQFLTGNFRYSLEERTELQTIVDSGDFTHEYGKIKFNEILLDICDEQRVELERSGLNTEDILEIHYYNIGTPKNEFVQGGKKKLPEPILLKSTLSRIEDEEMKVGMYNSQIKNGYKLTSEELYEKLGIELNWSGKPIEEVTEYEYFDSSTGKIDPNVHFYYLLSKDLAGKLTDEEEQTLERYVVERIGKNLITFRKELQTYIPKNELSSDTTLNIVRQMLPLITHFKQRRLTYNKFPVWIEVDRYLHIYLRHVDDVQAGKSNKEKSTLKYHFQDIDGLIEMVLESLSSDIQKHFEENPTKPFKRQGSEAYEFKGDYYNISIEPSGKLMAFYSRK